MRESRVVLAAPTPDDEEEFTAAMRASRELHRPWITMPETPSAFGAFLETLADDRVDGSLVRRREDGALVGFFNLSEIVRGGFQSAFLGYGAVAPFAGQGYMTEAMQLVLQRTFQTLRLHRVEANIQPGNRASIALARRSGFELEGFSPHFLRVGGRWCDHERWAIRASIWHEHARP